MFRFKVNQKIFEIGGVKIGGAPWENPPVLVGSIFYHKHKVVKDENSGNFDRGAAEELIKNAEELSSKTKIPAMLDVVSTSPNAVIKYLEFISNTTKMPILIDAPSKETMEAAFKFARDVGLIDRIVYNSLTAKSKDEEFELLQKYNIKSSIFLLYTERVIDVDVRLKNLELILEKAKNYGIDKMLIDTFVIDIPSLSAAMRAIIEIKSRYGLPCGAGAHNAISSQRKSFRERFGVDGTKACELSSNLAPIIMGADFLLYGPIESAKEIFPAVYTIYTSYRYLGRKKELLIEI
ncbi:MAG: tetrahydromethanopterin S-methyltransferase subunit H [Ignisphaera sp.]|nr:tetrahydromethanopterin S-methyltransferase subunit H [Ignisphaera sp.]MDW8086039.1 tetrahydromethanopterin S-methyltransferase subunit H [Ignisphaera sp.]